jgi:hypothetical protein
MGAVTPYQLEQPNRRRPLPLCENGRGLPAVGATRCFSLPKAASTVFNRSVRRFARWWSRAIRSIGHCRGHPGSEARSRLGSRERLSAIMLTGCEVGLHIQSCRVTAVPCWSGLFSSSTRWGREPRPLFLRFAWLRSFQDDRIGAPSSHWPTCGFAAAEGAQARDTSRPPTLGLMPPPR